MYIYLFAILPVFYLIIIYLLFIFLIIYWLATVGDLVSATYRNENCENYKFYNGEYVFYDSWDLSWPFYSNLNDQ